MINLLVNYPWSTHWWTTPDQPIDELPLINLLMNYSSQLIDEI